MAKYVIAEYMRLSVDDNITESLSISNQKAILEKFIDDLEIPNIEVIEKIDNGYTGTNMERPAVQELLDLVRSGGVNMICVKDFSRFSRRMVQSRPVKKDEICTVCKKTPW
jgi:DNA invertase Pin-like site-specific DNA recombinase